MSEDKMREEFEAQFAGYVFTQNAFGHYVNFDLQEMWRGWKACAAIKDAEIAARDLIIMELREAVEQADIRSGMLKIREALAKSEHHDSRALEKMLLAERLEALEEVNGLESWVIDREISDYKAKLAELNKE